MRRKPTHVYAVQSDRTAIEALETSDWPQQGGLAAARGRQERYERIRSDRKAHLIERTQGAAFGRFELSDCAFNFQDRFQGDPLSCSVQKLEVAIGRPLGLPMPPILLRTENSGMTRRGSTSAFSEVFSDWSAVRTHNGAARCLLRWGAVQFSQAFMSVNISACSAGVAAAMTWPLDMIDSGAPCQSVIRPPAPSMMGTRAMKS